MGTLLVMIFSLAPDCILGLGITLGASCLLGITAMYAVLAWRFTIAGKFVCCSLTAAALLAFIYFLPYGWVCRLIKAGYEARLWVHRPGLAKWL